MKRITWDDVDVLEATLATQGFHVRYKDESRAQRLLAALLRPFNRDYLTRYTTVMFGRIWFPSRAWRKAMGAEAIWATLRHEAVHVADMRRFPVFFQLSYALLLPAGLTMRAFWEWRGYTETLRAHFEVHGAIDDALLDEIAERFTGPDYLYMLPFPGLVRRRLDVLRQRIIDG